MSVKTAAKIRQCPHVRCTIMLALPLGEMYEEKGGLDLGGRKRHCKYYKGST